MESLGIEIGWPSKKPQEKQSRVHNHHVSLRDRIKELQIRSHGKHPKSGEQGHGGNKETTKAVAWAVFQHHEGGAGHSHTHGMAVRRPTRFKIEAQMKQEVAHRSVYEGVVTKWDAGSTLFDSFELSSLMKTLDKAAHAAPASIAEHKLSHADEDDAIEAGAMVVYTPKSPTHWTSRREAHAPPERHNLGEAEARRHDHVDELRPHKAHGESGQGQRAVRYSLNGSARHGRNGGKDDPSSVFGHWSVPKDIVRRSFDSSTSVRPAKGVSSHHHDHDHHHHHHHNRWKSLLHTLHLDGAHGLFHGFHKSHTQVAPHDLEKTQHHKSRSHRHKFERTGSHSDTHLDKELYDDHFERNDLPVSKDVNPPAEQDDDHHHHHHHHPHFWKFGFKKALTQPFCRSGPLLSDNEGHDHEESSSHKSHKKHGHKHADLRAAWSSLTSNLLHLNHHHDHHKHEHGSGRHEHGSGHHKDGLEGEDHSVIEHHHHHHHHHHHEPDGEDDELTVQAISKRVARLSFDHKKSRRLSIEEGGLKAPRNSLETPFRTVPS